MYQGYNDYEVEIMNLNLELDRARKEAETLAFALLKKHYQEESPNFELCDSVAGVISQIDNMVCTLVKPE